MRVHFLPYRTQQFRDFLTSWLTVCVHSQCRQPHCSRSASLNIGRFLVRASDLRDSGSDSSQMYIGHLTRVIISKRIYRLPALVSSHRTAHDPRTHPGHIPFRRPHITNLCQTKSTTWLERSDALNSGPHGCSVGPLRRCEWYAGSRGVVRFRIRTDTKHLFAFSVNFAMCLRCII